jgi:hypothetical protein
VLNCSLVAAAGVADQNDADLGCGLLDWSDTKFVRRSEQIDQLLAKLRADMVAQTRHK